MLLALLNTFDDVVCQRRCSHCSMRFDSLLFSQRVGWVAGRRDGCRRRRPSADAPQITVDRAFLRFIVERLAGARGAAAVVVRLRLTDAVARSARRARAAGVWRAVRLLDDWFCGFFLCIGPTKTTCLSLDSFWRSVSLRGRTIRFITRYSRSLRRAAVSDSSAPPNDTRRQCASHAKWAVFC